MMCEFHDCICNDLGDIWWTDKCMYFSSIDIAQEASMTKNKHCDRARLLNYFIHLLLGYDMKK